MLHNSAPRCCGESEHIIAQDGFVSPSHVTFVPQLVEEQADAQEQQTPLDLQVHPEDMEMQDE